MKAIKAITTRLSWRTLQITRQSQDGSFRDGQGRNHGVSLDLKIPEYIPPSAASVP
jgi:hypothetical protein